MFQKPKIAICLILVILGSSLLSWNAMFAQSKKGQFMAELSVSFLDYRAFQTGDFLQYKSFDPGITMAGHAYLSKALNLSINTTFVPEADWVTEEGQFRATSLLDANALIQLKTNGTILPEDALIAPYIATGFGMNTASNNIRLYVPATFGLRFQVSENFSLHFAGTYKQKTSAAKHQHMAYTAGFVFAMPSKKGKGPAIDPPVTDPGNENMPVAVMNSGKADADGDGVPDEDDLCPDVRGKVMYLGCPDGVSQDVADVKVDPEPANNYEPVVQKPSENIVIEPAKPTNPVPTQKAKPISAEDRDYLNYAMKNIFFEPSSDKIREDSYPVLDEISRILGRYPAYSLEVVGHTDNSGTNQNNMILSVMRAYRVKYYLVNQKGIKMSRITSDGQSSSNPMYNNNTAEGRAKNRRVELKMTPSSELQKSMFRGEQIIIED